MLLIADGAVRKKIVWLLPSVSIRSEMRKRMAQSRSMAVCISDAVQKWSSYLVFQIGSGQTILSINFKQFLEALTLFLSSFSRHLSSSLKIIFLSSFAHHRLSSLCSSFLHCFVIAHLYHLCSSIASAFRYLSIPPLFYFFLFDPPLFSFFFIVYLSLCYSSVMFFLPIIMKNPTPHTNSIPPSSPDV